MCSILLNTSIKCKLCKAWVGSTWDTREHLATRKRSRSCSPHDDLVCICIFVCKLQLGRRCAHRAPIFAH